jgi:hypothetical protein
MKMVSMRQSSSYRWSAKTTTNEGATPAVRHSESASVAAATGSGFVERPTVTHRVVGLTDVSIVEFIS